jgi:hypothetical protein
LVATELSAGDDVPPDFWDRLRTRAGIATGPRAVIEAVQTGRVGPDGHGYLVLGPDQREACGRCLACRTLSADPTGPCPKCQASCAPGNLWEELLLLALRHRLAVRFMMDPQRLRPYGGLVAALK